MFDNDYRDVDFGWLDDVIDKASFPYYAFVITGKTIAANGSEVPSYTRYIINGSLQAFKRSRRYGEDQNNANASGRGGKFYAKYDVILKEGDMLQRMDNGITYRVTQVADFDYVGVRNYEVERIGIDELQNYDFSAFVEGHFEDATIPEDAE